MQAGGGVRLPAGARACSVPRSPTHGATFICSVRLFPNRATALYIDSAMFPRGGRHPFPPRESPAPFGRALRATGAAVAPVGRHCLPLRYYTPYGESGRGMLPPLLVGYVVIGRVLPCGCCSVRCRLRSRSLAASAPVPPVRTCARSAFPRSRPSRFQLRIIFPIALPSVSQNNFFPAPDRRGNHDFGSPS